jgi:hypothetical protein
MLFVGIQDMLYWCKEPQEISSCCMYGMQGALMKVLRMLKIANSNICENTQL